MERCFIIQEGVHFFFRAKCDRSMHTFAVEVHEGKFPSSEPVRQKRDRGRILVSENAREKSSAFAPCFHVSICVV